MIYFSIAPVPTISTLFPYTTLFRSDFLKALGDRVQVAAGEPAVSRKALGEDQEIPAPLGPVCVVHPEKAADVDQPDRKSTRLNSSHANISYAVFCLKKKK